MAQRGYKDKPACAIIKSLEKTENFLSGMLEGFLKRLEEMRKIEV